MRKLVVSTWVALDGVFDADSMETWFNPFDSEERQTYIKEVVFASDAILVGRVTYEMLASYWPNQKHNEFGIADRLNGMPKYVVSSSLKNAEWNNSTVIKGQVAEQVSNLKRQAGHDIVIFGSATLVQSLLPANLIDEVKLLVHPVVMGRGKRFFKEGMTARLKLVRTKPLGSGVIAVAYAPIQISSSR